MNPLRLATCAATPLLGCVMLLGAVMPARAVPLFARQTGQN